MSHSSPVTALRSAKDARETPTLDYHLNFIPLAELRGKHKTFQAQKNPSYLNLEQKLSRKAYCHGFSTRRGRKICLSLGNYKGVIDIFMSKLDEGTFRRFVQNVDTWYLPRIILRVPQ